MTSNTITTQCHLQTTAEKEKQREKDTCSSLQKEKRSSYWPPDTRQVLCACISDIEAPHLNSCHSSRRSMPGSTEVAAQHCRLPVVGVMAYAKP